MDIRSWLSDVKTMRRRDRLFNSCVFVTSGFSFGAAFAGNMSANSAVILMGTSSLISLVVVVVAVMRWR